MSDLSMNVSWITTAQPMYILLFHHVSWLVLIWNQCALKPLCVKPWHTFSFNPSLLIRHYHSSDIQRTSNACSAISRTAALDRDPIASLFSLTPLALLMTATRNPVGDGGDLDDWDVRIVSPASPTSWFLHLLYATNFAWFLAWGGFQFLWYWI